MLENIASKYAYTYIYIYIVRARVRACLNFQLDESSNIIDCLSDPVSTLVYISSEIYFVPQIFIYTNYTRDNLIRKVTENCVCVCLCIDVLLHLQLVNCFLFVIIYARLTKFDKA